MQLAQAAKEKMHAPVFSLAASAATAAITKSAGTNPIPQSDAWPGQHVFFKTNPISGLAQNSRLGHQLPTAILYQGLGPAISNTAIGFRHPLYDFRVRPRCTSKERDAETGLDFFGARYLSSAQGRFTSADPIWVTLERLADPQRLNLYAYARNNPLRFNDPDGMDIRLGRCSTGSQQECFEQLQAGVNKKDREHVHLVKGDGTNGFKKGEYGITVDADYKSDSKNFQTLQKLAGDHTATAQVDVLMENDKFSVQISFSASRDASGKMIYGPLSTVSMTPGQDGGFEGYTIFPPSSGLQPYSSGDFTDVVVNASRGDVTQTIHHELRHVLLGDFGRAAANAAHGAGNVNRETQEAEKEAAKNEKQK